MIRSLSQLIQITLSNCLTYQQINFYKFMKNLSTIHIGNTKPGNS